MKQIATWLAATALLAGGALPVAAQSGSLSDAVCVQLLGKSAAKLKDKQGLHAVAMNFQGYYTARIRASLGPGGNIAAALKAGRDAAAKMSRDQHQEASVRCLGLAAKDMEQLFDFNDQLGANPPDS